MSEPKPSPSEILDALVPPLRGRFLVFEGGDGSGKTTQLRRFISELEERGADVFEVREPGGTRVGEKIRSVLLEPSDEAIDARTEMLLYMASRAQLAHRRIRPTLDAGKLVVADRFVSSTIAYQGSGGGVPVEEIESVARTAVAGCEPDLVVIFDVDQQTAMARLNPLLRGESLDRMEQKDAAFHARVRRGYIDLADRHPESHVLIDGCGEEAAVFERLLDALWARFGSDSGG